MMNEEREKEIRKLSIPTKEECIAFYKELVKLADIRFVPYYKMAIEALEQESVLDKIRTKIENHCGLAKENHCRYCCYCTNLMGVREILEVIDKHMVESEDKE